eukprot:jgi/Ulvmu1/10819/UM069_0055.1
MLSRANACSCIFPPPLSDCDVRDDHAALLLTIKCVTTQVCDAFSGTAVADAEITQVFKDRTSLKLKKGDVVSIRSALSSAACGAGESFKVGDQWIMFANRPFEPDSFQVVDELTIDPGDPFTPPEVTFCDVSEAELETSICAGNVFKPMRQNITDITRGCSVKPIIKPILTPPIKSGA